jgi:hypothetical protein
MLLGCVIRQLTL